LKWKHKTCLFQSPHTTNNNSSGSYI